MMAEQKLAVIIHDGAARGRAAQIGIAVFLIVYCFVDAGQQLVDSAVDVVGTAERAHDAGLCFGVTLLDRQLLVAKTAGNLRPLADVVPVLIACQQRINRRKRFVSRAEYKLTVRAAGRPVHQARHLKGRRVGHTDADVIRHTPGARLVFVRGHGSVRRNQNAQSGGVGRVLAGPVNAVVAFETVQRRQHRVCLPAGDVIKVQRDYVPARYGVRFAPSSGESASHKAAHILQIVLLGFFHFGVFGQSFHAAGGRFQAVIELRNRQRLALPVNVLTALARRNDNWSVVGHGGSFAPFPALSATPHGGFFCGARHRAVAHRFIVAVDSVQFFILCITAYLCFFFACRTDDLKFCRAHPARANQRIVQLRYLVGIHVVSGAVTLG